MKALMAICAIVLTSECISQTPNEILAKIFESQKKINTASYEVNRIDTFASGGTRSNNGHCRTSRDNKAPEFGQKLWAKRADKSFETLYDGNGLYVLNYQDSSYALESEPKRFKGIRSNPAGQLLFLPLLNLDTT
jgi:outer membrane lipoprotein-sorting protein